MIDYSVSKKINPRNKDEDPKYYANPQVSESVSLEKFARHISDHNSKYNRADVSAVLTQSVDCLREMLLEGKKIQLGDLGSFSIGLNSKGALTAEMFNPDIHIKKIHVNWTPGESFTDLMKDVTWNRVANRKAQNALLKAVTNGDTTVNLEGEEEDGEADV